MIHCRLRCAWTEAACNSNTTALLTLSGVASVRRMLSMFGLRSRAQSLVGVDADAVRMATDQLLHLAGASAAEGVEGPQPGGWQAWSKAVNASSAGCGPPGAHSTPGDDASGVPAGPHACGWASGCCWHALLRPQAEAVSRNHSRQAPHN